MFRKSLALSSRLEFSGEPRWYLALGLALVLHTALGVSLGSAAERWWGQQEQAPVDRWIGQWMELGEVVAAPAAPVPARGAEAMDAADPGQAAPGSNVSPTPAASLVPSSGDVARPRAAPRASVSPRTRPAAAEGDWLRVEDQLPASVEEPSSEAKRRPPRRAEPPSKADRARVDAFAFRPSAAQEEAEPGAESPMPAAALGSSGTLHADQSSAGVRNLATAFTRAVPVATDGDGAWRSLAAGRAGSFEFTLRVDASGTIVDATVHDSAPPHFERLLASTLRYLEKGRFAVTRLGLGEGSLRLQVEVTLSERPLIRQGSRGAADPAARVAYGFEAPSRERPGRAWFQYGSGRFFEARVRLK